MGCDIEELATDYSRRYEKSVLYNQTAGYPKKKRNVGEKPRRNQIAHTYSIRSIQMEFGKIKKSPDPGSNQGPQDDRFFAEQDNYSLALFQLSYQGST